LNSFNRVETCTTGTRGWFFLVASRRVQNTRVLGEWQCCNAEREEAKGHVYACDWLSGFLFHFIFKLNYFTANYFFIFIPKFMIIFSL
jgi:hypothetical protein